MPGVKDTKFGMHAAAPLARYVSGRSRNWFKSKAPQWRGRQRKIDRMRILGVRMSAFGHKADISRHLLFVRFWGQSGHGLRDGMPLLTQSKRQG
jgi:hypothetical protein